MNIFILSPHFKKTLNDKHISFITQFACNFVIKDKVIVLTTKISGLKEFETLSDIKVFRHQQFILKNFYLVDYINPQYETIKKNLFKTLIIPFFIYYQIKAAFKIINNEKIDIINAHWLLIQGLSISILKKIFFIKSKFVLTVHGSDILKFPKLLLKLYFKIFSYQIDAIIAPNNFIVQKIQDCGYRGKIERISMGINTQKFKKLDHKKDSNNFKVLFIGNLIFLKGVDVLIKSTKILSDNKVKFNLNIIGRGNDKNEFENIARNLALEDYISFLGLIDNELLQSYYNDADIFVLPSLSEGWPVVVMEALSCGCICIVTDIPAFEEYKDKYEFLHIVEKANPQALADKIFQIHNNLEYYKSFKQQARDFAVNNFDWEIITKNYLKVFKDVLNEN